MFDIISSLIVSSDRELTNELVNSEVIYVSQTLELMRDAKKISNDAYLDSGSIQGGLSVISSLLEQGVQKNEINLLLNTLLERAKALNSKYPELNGLIESYRNT
ncbi:MAG: hypothetical protein ACKVIE_01335 [Candidatus Poseidoniales archaeon]|jgi:hypothetical protein|tara:strand:- start:128 stop:439 length:312 start_codon:yes stop_codon:yes gene_type:complete